MAEETPEIRALAERIADCLFTSGPPKLAVVAQRLVLTIDTPEPRNLGGWCKEAVADVIARELANATATCD